MAGFRSVFETWYPRLVRQLALRLGDTDQAEDVAQEAFLRLLSAAPRDPVAWLFTVGGNLATDHTRVAQGRARHLALIGSELSNESEDDPEAAMLRAEAVARVRRALARLPERDRTLLLLHHDGVRYRDIARHTGVAPSSVGSLLTRAQRRFVKCYESLGEEEYDAREASNR
ncbi:MAG TPA: sigma-70 family RNA polymerase sigma factor [Gemmatimonadaceae bacterium]|nr:sigma-70 family RNA polymerase sigma factor [Gemmatimonadaceae bacterium]